MLAVYGAIVAVTVVWAPPSSAAKNEIGATILVLEGDMVVGRYFVIHNESRSHWQQVTVSIDDGFSVPLDLVRAGEKVTLYVKDFEKKVIRRRRGRDIPKTVAAPVDMPITELRIACSEGVAVEPIGAVDGAEPALFPRAAPPRRASISVSSTAWRGSI